MRYDGCFALEKSAGVASGRPFATSMRIPFRAPERSQNAPLAGLEDSVLSERFRSWRGKSGRRYIFSIQPRHASGTPYESRFADAVIVVAMRLRDGERRIVWIGQTGPVPELLFDSAPFAELCSQASTELHVHLLAPDRAARHAVIDDIRGLAA